MTTTVASGGTANPTTSVLSKAGSTDKKRNIDVIDLTGEDGDPALNRPPGSQPPRKKGRLVVELRSRGSGHERNPMIEDSTTLKSETEVIDLSGNDDDYHPASTWKRITFHLEELVLRIDSEEHHCKWIARSNSWELGGRDIALVGIISDSIRAIVARPCFKGYGYPFNFAFDKTDREFVAPYLEICASIPKREMEVVLDEKSNVAHGYWNHRGGD